MRLIPARSCASAWTPSQSFSLLDRTSSVRCFTSIMPGSVSSDGGLPELQKSSIVFVVWPLSQNPRHRVTCPSCEPGLSMTRAPMRKMIRLNEDGQSSVWPSQRSWSEIRIWNLAHRAAAENRHPVAWSRSRMTVVVIPVDLHVVQRLQFGEKRSSRPDTKPQRHRATKARLCRPAQRYRTSSCTCRCPTAIS